MAIAFPGGCLERGLAAGRQDGQRPHEEAAWQVWLTQEAWAPTCMGAFLLLFVYVLTSVSRAAVLCGRGKQPQWVHLALEDSRRGAEAASLSAVV